MLALRVFWRSETKGVMSKVWILVRTRMLLVLFGCKQNGAAMYNESERSGT